MFLPLASYELNERINSSVSKNAFVKEQWSVNSEQVNIQRITEGKSDERLAMLKVKCVYLSDKSNTYDFYSLKMNALHSANISKAVNDEKRNHCHHLTLAA